MKSDTKIKSDILKLLRSRGEMHIKAIAEKLKISSTTISKYLAILEAEGEVLKAEKRPYILWRMQDNDSKTK